MLKSPPTLPDHITKTPKKLPAMQLLTTEVELRSLSSTLGGLRFFMLLELLEWGDTKRRLVDG